VVAMGYLVEDFKKRY